MLRIGAFGGFGGERRLHHEPHLSQLLKRRVVEEKEKLHGHGEYRGGISVEVTAIADLLRDDAHDLKHLKGRS